LEDEFAFAVDAALTIVTGDFNEPSHRDWSPAAAETGRHPLAVQYPTVLALETMGFLDAFRTFFPDEVAHPGFTWTPITSRDDPADHHDRIDFVLVRGAAARVTGAWVVGESAETADVVVQPWNSDHRGVVVEVKIP
jgi:exonuclease III